VRHAECLSIQIKGSAGEIDERIARACASSRPREGVTDIRRLWRRYSDRQRR
jgi:hypothetical protein